MKSVTNNYFVVFPAGEEGAATDLSPDGASVRQFGARPGSWAVARLQHLCNHSDQHPPGGHSRPEATWAVHVCPPQDRGYGQLQ